MKSIYILKRLFLIISVLMVTLTSVTAANITAGTSNYNVTATSAGGTAFTSSDNLTFNGWGNPTWTLTANVQVVDLTMSDSPRLNLNGYTLTVTGNLVIGDNNGMQINLGTAGQLLVSGNATIGSSCGITGAGACVFQVGGNSLMASNNNTFITLGASGTLKAGGNVTVGSGNIVTVGTLEMTGCGQNMDVSTAFSVTTFKQSSSCGTTITRSGGTSTITTTTYDQNGNATNIKPATNFTISGSTINAPKTWDGGGADNNMMTAANWSGDVAPSAGDQLVFAGSTRTSPVNNYTAGTVFSSITFSSGASSFSISGNAMTLSGGAITASNTSNTMTISANLTFSTTAPTISVASGGTLVLSGTVANGGYAITSSSTGTTTFSGVISGTGAFTNSGSGTTTLSGTNTFSGGVNLNAGTLNINNATALGTGTFTIANGTTINNTSGSTKTLTTNNPQTWNGDFTFTGSSNLDLGTGAVSLGSSTRTITVSGNTLAVGGVISGSGGITKSGTSAILNLYGTNTYTGTTTITTGVLLADNASALGSTAGGTVVSSNGQLVLKSYTYAAEPLTINGNFNNDATYPSALRNSVSGASTVTWTGDITLGSNSVIGSVASGDVFTISGVISGAFTLTKLDAGTLKLSGTNTYTGATTVSAGILQLNNTAALGTTAAGTTIASGAALDLNGITYSSAEALTISGTGISSGGAINNSSATAATFGGLITLAGASSIEGGTGTIAITNGGTITGATFGLTIGGVQGGSISSAIGTTSGTLTKEDAGTWTLSGINTYTGLTTISAGILKLNNTAALGTTAAGTIVSSGGALDLNGLTYSTAEALTINGTGVSNGGALMNSNGTGATFAGLITLGSASSIEGGTGTIAISNAGTITGATFGLTLGGAQGGSLTSILGTTSGTLTKEDAGTWTLTGASTYTGITTISAGTILVGGNVAVSTNSPLGNAASAIIMGDANTTTNGSSPQLLLNGAFTFARPITIADFSTSGWYYIGGNTNNNATFSGLVTFSQSFSFTQIATTGGNLLTISGGVTGGKAGTNTFYFANTGDINVTTTAISNGTGTTKVGKSSTGTTTLSVANTYSGQTFIQGGTLKAGVATSAFGSNSWVYMDNTAGVTLNLNGYNNSIGSISAGGSTGGNVTLGSATLTIGGDNTTPDAYAGAISGTGGITKTGTGTITFSGTNTYTGATTISQGILAAGSTSAFGSNSAVTLANVASTSLNTTGYNNSIGSITGGGATGGNVTLGAATLTIGGDNTSPSAYAGAISGTGGITKTGTGTQTFSGTNTYTGATTISQGILAAGSTSAFGSNSAVTLANVASTSLNTTGYNNSIGSITGGGATGGNVTLGAATLTIGGNNTSPSAYAGVISGTGGITKTGTGTITFSGTNTYTGATTISQGILAAGSTSAFGSNSAVTLANVASTSLNTTGYNNSIGSITGGGATGGNVTLGAATLTIGGNNTSPSAYAGVISGTGGITKTGTGTITFSGTNTYTGATTISQGVLAAGSTSAFGSNSAVTLANVASTSLNTTGYNNSIGSITGGGATGGNVTLGAATLTIGGDNTSPSAYAGAISGTGGITKTGTGTITFSGTNTYTGATTISQGILAAGSTSAFGSNSAVTLANVASTSLNTTGYNNSIGSLTGGGSTGGNVTLGAATLTIGGDNSSPSAFAGIISGTGAITKSGTGTLTYTGANTYSGGTTISAGTLQIGSGATSGDNGTLPGNVVNNATLTFNRYQAAITYSGNISGTGAVNQNGVCTSASTYYLSLSGTNTYTGLTTIGSSSTLQLGSTSALGSTASGTVITSGGILDLNGQNYSSSEPLSVGGSGVGGSVGAILNRQNNSSATYAGLLTLTADTKIAANQSTINLTNTGTITGSGFTLSISGTESGGWGSGSISSIIGLGTGGVTKNGTSTWTLTGVNTYSGATSVTAGTLKLGASGVIPDASSLSVSSGAIFDVNTYSETVGSIAGAGTIDNVSGAGTPTLTCGGDNTTTSFTGIIQNTTGTLALIKTGTGTLTLSGANTYTGATTVSAGILKVGHATALGTTAAGTTVSSGAALDLNGTTYSNTEALTISGTGVSSGGAMINTGSSASFAGTVTMAAATTVTANNQITLSGTISPSTYSLTKAGTSSLVFTSNTATVNALAISAGTLTAGSSTINIYGNFTNSGTFTCGTGTVAIKGSSAQNIAAATFNNLTIDNSTSPSTSAATLTGNISVGGTLTMTTGILNTSTYTIDLGANGSISETNPSALAPISYVTGYVTATRSLIQNVANTFGGVGLSLTETTQASNSTVITRRTGTASIGVGNSSILRYFDISPTVNTGLNATLVFSYTNTELNGQSEDSLKLYRSTDAGSTWTKKASTVVNSASNSVSLSGISAFSRWTASNKVSNPLPVDFVSFTATKGAEGNLLNWQTAQETNNDYFDVERSHDGIDYEKVTSVKGSGTKNSSTDYSYIDKFSNYLLPTYYRLKQVDYDKKFEYSNIIFINGEQGHKEFHLYPNPLEEGNVLYACLGDDDEGIVKVSLFDMTGALLHSFLIDNIEVGSNITLENENMLLKKGMYIVEIKTIHNDYKQKLEVK